MKQTSYALMDIAVDFVIILLYTNISISLIYPTNVSFFALLVCMQVVPGYPAMNASNETLIPLMSVRTSEYTTMLVCVP